MKDFLPVAFDYGQCRQELQAFRRLLDSKEELRENADLKPSFEANHFLSSFLASYSWDATAIDRLSFQYQLFGDFSCDVVAGDSTHKVFGFIELEDATPDSIFRRQGQKASLEWAPRFEHAFSQVVDWFWKLDDMERTDEFELRFGSRPIRYFGLIVLGRDRWLTDPREQRRWFWRSERVLVNSRPVLCVTYDQVYERMADRLEKFFPPSSGSGEPREATREPEEQPSGPAAG